MSVPAISSVSPYLPSGPPTTQSNFQKIKGELQQLGQDLQSGNLSQAQQDFATLSKDLPSNQQNSPLGRDLATVGKDLQSGNLSAAQQDFATFKQQVQAGHRHHHHHGAGATSGQSNSLAQDFGSLGQALQSGNLSAAQQAYSSLQQDLQQFTAAAGSGSSNAAVQPTQALSVTA